MSSLVQVSITICILQIKIKQRKKKNRRWSESVEKVDRLIKYYVRTGNWFMIKIVGYPRETRERETHRKWSCFMQLETSDIVSVCVIASAMESSVKCPKPETVII